MYGDRAKRCRRSPTRMRRHYLGPAPKTLHGYFSRELEPALIIDSGDVVTFQTLDSGWGAIEQEPGFSEPYDFTPRDLAHDVAHATFWDLDPDAGIGISRAGQRVELRPFMGIMGMPLDQPGIQSTFPPTRCGGNLDCRELTEGTALFLPIAVDGALFSTGDGHAVQGDGEVA